MASMWPSIHTMVSLVMQLIVILIGLSAGHVIGVCGGPFLRPDSAFIGLYAVRKEYFGQQIGQKLFNAVMSHIGDRNCCLSSVPDKVRLYKDRLGFTIETGLHMVIYYTKPEDKLQTISTNKFRIEPFYHRLLEELVEYDQRIHHLTREPLLRLSLNEPQCLTLVAIDSNTRSIVGYGCIRENSVSMATLSPVYADNKQIAGELVKNLINGFDIASTNGVFYYTLDANESAIELAEELNLERHEKCPILYRRSVIDIDHYKIYSILTPNFSL